MPWWTQQRLRSVVTRMRSVVMINTLTTLTKRTTPDNDGSRSVLRVADRRSQDYASRGLHRAWYSDVLAVPPRHHDLTTGIPRGHTSVLAPAANYRWAAVARAWQVYEHDRRSSVVRITTRTSNRPSSLYVSLYTPLSWFQNSQYHRHLIVHSKLDYCNSLYCNLPYSQLNRLQ